MILKFVIFISNTYKFIRLKMFKLTRLGKKIIEDSQRPQKNKSLLATVDDDSFQRYRGGSLCERGSDVYYHGGGHHHDHDDGLTEDQRYEKAMY